MHAVHKTQWKSSGETMQRNRQITSVTISSRNDNDIRTKLRLKLKIKVKTRFSKCWQRIEQKCHLTKNGKQVLGNSHRPLLHQPILSSQIWHLMTVFWHHISHQQFPMDRQMPMAQQILSGEKPFWSVLLELKLEPELLKKSAIIWKLKVAFNS